MMPKVVKGKTMSDLISRQAAIDALRFCELGMETETIANLQSIDAIPVVRCADCKHSKEDTVFGGRWCQLPGSIKVVREEFFCADGERRL